MPITTIDGNDDGANTDAQFFQARGKNPKHSIRCPGWEHCLGRYQSATDPRLGVPAVSRFPPPRPLFVFVSIFVLQFSFTCWLG